MKSKKMPSIKNLSKEIETGKITTAITYLINNKSFFVGYPAIDDLAFHYADKPNDKEWKAFDYNFMLVQQAIYHAFYKREVYLSSSALYDLLFNSLKSQPNVSVISEVVTKIKNLGLHKKGIVIFPIHSFGVLALGFLPLLKKKGQRDLDYWIMPDTNFAVFPQTNSKEKTVSLIKKCIQSFGVKYNGDFPEDNFDHYLRSRGTHWLHKNPLIVAAFNFSSNQSFENQFYITQYIEKCSTALHFISAEQNVDKLPTKKILSMGSTRQINNWQTLDIHHYITMMVTPKKKLYSNITPINLNRIGISELIAINIEISHKLEVKGKHRVKKWILLLDEVFSNYNIARWKKQKQRTKKDLFLMKVIDSLAFYRRSFRSTSHEEKVVNLATAFESLLLDHYNARTTSIDKAFHDRILKLYGKSPDASKYAKATQDLYSERCEIVHRGERLRETDNLKLAQSAYIVLIERLFRKNALDFSSDTPIQSFFKKRGVKS